MAQPTIEFSAYYDSNTATIASINLPAGTNFLLVLVSGEEPFGQRFETNNTISYNGTGLTFVSRFFNGGFGVYCHYLENPATGSAYNLTTTDSLSAYRENFGVVGLSGVDVGGTPLGTPVSAQATAPANPSITIDSSADAICFQNAFYSTHGWNAWNTGQSQIGGVSVDGNGYLGRFASQSPDTGSTTVMTFDPVWSGTTVGVSVYGASAGGSIADRSIQPYKKAIQRSYLW